MKAFILFAITALTLTSSFAQAIVCDPNSLVEAQYSHPLFNEPQASRKSGKDAVQSAGDKNLQACESTGCSCTPLPDQANVQEFVRTYWVDPAAGMSGGPGMPPPPYQVTEAYWTATYPVAGRCTLHPVEAKKALCDALYNCYMQSSTSEDAKDRASAKFFQNERRLKRCD